MPQTSVTKLRDIAARIEAQRDLPAPVARDCAEVLSPHLDPAETMTPDQLASTDYVLHLADRAVPGWSIHLRGIAHATDGHWHCTIRPSETRDEAEMMGHAHGPDLSNAVLAALMRLVALRIERAG